MRLNNMDQLDIRILNALQGNGSLTKSELAELVGSTPSTCLRRAQRLIETGYLDRCVYIANPKKLDRGIRAFISVVTKDHGGDQAASFIERLAEEPSISQAYGTTGDVDAILIANFVDLEEYRLVCERLFADDPLVVRYTTTFGVQTYKETTEISTDELQRKTSTR